MASKGLVNLRVEPGPVVLVLAIGLLLHLEAVFSDREAVRPSRYKPTERMGFRFAV